MYLSDSSNCRNPAFDVLGERKNCRLNRGNNCNKLIHSVPAPRNVLVFHGFKPNQTSLSANIHKLA